MLGKIEAQQKKGYACIDVALRCILSTYAAFACPLPVITSFVIGHHRPSGLRVGHDQNGPMCPWRNAIGRWCTGQRGIASPCASGAVPVRFPACV